MTHRVAAFLLCALAAGSPCEPDAPFSLTAAAVGDSVDETGLLMRGCDDEDCICAALRLGWPAAAKAGVQGRKKRRESTERVRRFAQGTVQNASAVLARVHPRYPRHVRFLPALEWAQNDEVVQVRLRHSRYNRGELVFAVAEAAGAAITDDGLHYAAEGDDRVGTVDTTLRWSAPLARRDGCADREASCAHWAAEGACAEEGEQLVRRCAKSCGACAAASGGAVVAATLQLGSGLLIEARKASSGRWARLLAEAKPAHRIGYIEADGEADGAPADAPPVGALLECHEQCRDADHAAGTDAAGTDAACGADAACVRECGAQYAGREA